MTLPAGLHAVQPCWYCVPNIAFIEVEMWEYSPKTVKNWNFGHDFAPQATCLHSFF